MLRLVAALLGAAVSSRLVQAASQAYTWNNVRIGGGGGFVPGIIFNPSQKGLAYARTDIGGAYKLNADDSWSPLLDFAGDSKWNYWGVDALATDPVTPARLYLATGMYTNAWDPNNGQILISKDYGATFTASALPFKVGGNMPGRGMGERLAIDPHSNGILYFGARSGHGLWKSTNFGVTWSQVTSFPNAGTYAPDPTDSSGYNSDKIGISWVTFDSNSGSAGSATPRIFVGVASNGTSNIFVTNDSGTTWSAVPGQSTNYFPHKGVLSPAEKVLYVSYSNGAGPYDGALGAVKKYNISSSSWTDITPVSGSDLYFGFGGVAVDLQKPGTIMVAALNSWWPDGQIFRSTDGGSTWTALWSWASYPTLNKYYSYGDAVAPWLGVPYTDTTAGNKQIGWMMEALVIDPFDSNHWLYGTGATIQGGRDLLKWDTTRNITLQVMASGIEETAVQSLISPPSGPSLLSAVGDIGGFVHNSLTVAPSTGFINPTWATTIDLDFAGNAPATIVRIGNGDASGGTLQAALSYNSGATWNQDYGASTSLTGGKVAISANADTVLWSTSSSGVWVSQYTSSFTRVSSLPATAIIASDKKNNAVFFAAYGPTFLLSTTTGASFTAVGTLGASTTAVKIVVNPSVTGDVWVSTDKGLFHSTNNGTTFTAMAGVTQAWAFALGAPATTGGYPAIYAAANIGGVVGYWRSDNSGAGWVQINDAAHGFGSAPSNVITADPRKYGRVYIGTNGRGIFYGDIQGTVTGPTTSTIATTSVSTTTPPTATVTPTTTPTTTTAAPSGTQTAYGQCGGQGWTGPINCASGYECVVQNTYYSQCVPA